jgi:tetratricopeptide (TPR) repeat protein
VAHAHNRLILHRDLKPTNILVTKSGDVKLLDFGIAKLLDDAGADAQTALTARAGNAFTPEFAAPEQLQGGDVTTATDVYALGVLMYLLLGGEHPTAAATGAPLARMRSVIETEPKRLSDAVLRRGGPTTRFSPESRKLSSEIKGDVETIVAKALKKVPAERYANAAELADDVRRYLAHEPIAARPDARLYRTAKFVQRHRAGVATAAAAVIALSVGVGVALWQAHEAQAQRVQAEGLIEYMIGDLRKKLQPVGRLDVLDGVGEKALAYYAAQNLGRLDADSLGRRARALHMIGSLAEQRGRFAEAERDFQQAAATTAELLERHPDDGNRIFDQSQSEFYLGYAQWRRGHLHDAEAAFRRYYALAQRMNQVQPDKHDWQLENVFAAQNVAIVLVDLGQPEEALQLSNQARSAIEHIERTHPEDAVSVGNTIGWSAIAQDALGHDDLAVVAENDKIAAARRAPGGDKDQDARFLIGNGHNEIAHWQRNLGLLDEGLATARLGLDELTVLMTLDPSNLDTVGEVVGTRLVIGELLADHGDFPGARAELAQADQLLARLTARPLLKRAWRLTHPGRAQVLRARLATTPAQRAAADLALVAYLADIRKYEQEGGELPAQNLPIVASAELAHGDLLAQAGQATGATTAWRSAAALMRPVAEHLNPAAMTLLALADFRLSGTQDARVWADRVVGTTYRHPIFADLQKQLGPAQAMGATPKP